MARSLADRIEQYIKVLIARSENGQIEIQRAELAETFDCVPSQVTYVLGTRFTQREGYYTESRRGGCGYVRITEYNSEYLAVLLDNSELFRFIRELYDKQKISEGEAEIIRFLALNAGKSLPIEYQLKLNEGFIKALEQFYEK
ncbi:MAG: CtsR family transcriptional regulator [Bacillota bacterium]|nr:CtsR family transcriptional regulator [Bacillota bacterium]